ncbi:MFS transporter [Geodermatophilus sp. SYSU D00758]
MGTGGARPAAPGDRRAVAVLCLTQFVLVVDVVVLNVALPAVQRSLGLAPADLGLAVVAYTLAFGSLLIAAGRAGDVLGRRRVFVAGLLVFTAASLLTGLAQETWQFLAARAGQGIGAALASPSALALLTTRFPDQGRRNAVLGLWAAVGSAGAVAGQVLGGLLVSTAGWRWVFLVNVPIGVAAALLATGVLHESRPERAGLDPVGALLLAAGLVPAVLVLTRLPVDGAGPGVLTGAVLAVVLLGALVVQQRRSRAPLVPPAVLAAPGVRAGNAALALSAAAVGATLLLTTLYLQVALDRSALFVGLAFAPVTALILVVAPVAGRLVSRAGARLPLVAGLATAAAGMLLLSRVPAGGSYVPDVLPGLLLVGVGSALGYAPSYVAATAAVAPGEQGTASGLLATAQELGPAVGLAVVAGLAVPAADGVAALVAGYRTGFLAAAGLAVLGAAVAVLLPRGLGRAGPREAVVDRADVTAVG